jgi:hypothetical protein
MHVRKSRKEKGATEQNQLCIPKTLSSSAYSRARWEGCDALRLAVAKSTGCDNSKSGICQMILFVEVKLRKREEIVGSGIG